jgi:Fe-S cluster assembly iron-binding protein IscA
MITLTTPAAAHLRAIMKHGRVPADHAVRLISNGKNGLSMTIGAAAEGDTVLTDETGPVLIIARDMASRLDGLVFDRVVTDIDGQTNVELSFRRPTAEELVQEVPLPAVAPPIVG